MSGDNGGMASSLRPAGSTTRWRRTRRYVLARDKGVCHLCGQGGADCVDHVVPRSKGGTDDLGNLKAAHATCNLRKGDRVVGGGVPPRDVQPTTSRRW